MISAIKEENKAIFAQRLSELMKDKKYTQMGLGKIVASRNSISCYLRGERTPSGSTLTLLAMELGVSPEYLAGESDYKTSWEMLDAEMKKYNPDLPKITISYDYFAEPGDNKQSEAFVCLLLSHGLSMEYIQDHANSLKKLDRIISSVVSAGLALIDDEEKKAGEEE